MNFKNFSKIYLLLFLGVFLFGSCEYAPTEEFINDIELQNPPLTVINLNNISSSFEISGYTEIQYDLEIENRRLYELKIYIDKDSIATMYSPSGSFFIHSSNFKDGTHTLKFQIITSTGNGSIADRFGAEAYGFTKTWNFTINNSPPKPVKIDTVMFSDGAVKIKWQKYERSDFISYQIRKRQYYQDYYSQDYGIGEIKDNQITEFLDTTFVGGDCYYELEIYTQNGMVESAEKFYSDSYPKFYPIENGNSSTIELKWSKCKYDKSFYEYVISRMNSSGVYKDFTISNINDTTFTDSDIEFSESYTYSVKTKSKPMNAAADPFPFETVDQTGFINCGNKLNSNLQASTLNYSTFYNSFYYTDEVMNFRRSNGNSLNHEALSSAYYIQSFDLSPDGKLLYVCDENRLLKIDPMNLTVQKEFPIKNVFGDSTSVGEFYITDDNKVFCQVFKNGQNFSNPERAILFDFESETILAELKYGNYGSLEIDLSSDGKYVLFDNKIYSVNSYGFSKIGNLSVSYNKFIHGTHNVVEVMNNSITIKKLEDLSVVAQFTTNRNLYIINIDPVTKNLCVIGDYEYIQIYDLQNGNLISEIKTSDPGYFFKYMNGILFSMDGYYLKIQ